MAEDIATPVDDTEDTGDYADSPEAKRHQELREGIELCERIKRDDLIPEWQINTLYRRGKAPNESNEARIPVPVDWAQTKAKIAALFSQVPQVVVEANDEESYGPAAPVVQKRLNRRLKEGGITAAMREVLPDIISTAGIGAVYVGYDVLTEPRVVQKGDSTARKLLGPLAELLGLNALLGEPEQAEEDRITDRRFYVQRLSPGDLLWPTEFTGSDFDQAPWIGNKGRMPWPMAKVQFKLDEKEKEKLVGDSRSDSELIVSGGTTGDEQRREKNVVEYNQIFYFRWRHHDDETSFSSIQRVVFLKGRNKPVIDELWRGMRLDKNTNTYIGACRYPIRVATLDYMSDEAVPPSTSEIGRPQVKELMRSRHQIIEQRDYAKPVRTFNSDRLDTDIQVALMAGDWQGWIPTQGDGTKIIAEIGRANYPPENWQMDAVIKGDLGDSWSQGPNQSGNFNTGRRSAEEARNVQTGYTTIRAQERAQLVEFFLGISDVFLGLMCLYDDFELPDLSQQDQARVKTFDRETIKHHMGFSIRGDGTVLLSAEEEYQTLERFINIAGKSGYLAPPSVLKRMASLSQLDPAEVLQPPPEKPPEPIKISLALNGSEDLGNPMVVATLIKNGQFPDIKELQGAKNAILEAMTLLPAARVPAPQPPGAPNKENEKSVPPMTDDRPEWQSVDRINSRRDASQNKGTP